MSVAWRPLTNWRSSEIALIQFGVENSSTLLCKLANHVVGIDLTSKIRLCEKVEDPVEVDCPTHEGWWAFKGHYVTQPEREFEYLYKVYEMPDDPGYFFIYADIDEIDQEPIEGVFEGKWKEVVVIW